MRRNNRTFRNLVLLICILYLTFLCVACDRKEDKSENQEKLREYSKRLQEDLARPNQEIVALLAIKYNQNMDLTEKIVDMYLTETDQSYRQVKSIIKKMNKGEVNKKTDEVNFDFLVLDKSAYADRVAKISNQFSLDQVIVASILFDYQTWEAAKSRATSE